MNEYRSLLQKGDDGARSFLERMFRNTGADVPGVIKRQRGRVQVRLGDPQGEYVNEITSARETLPSGLHNFDGRLPEFAIVRSFVLLLPSSAFACPFCVRWTFLLILHLLQIEMPCLKTVFFNAAAERLFGITAVEATEIVRNNSLRDLYRSVDCVLCIVYCVCTVCVCASYNVSCAAGFVVVLSIAACHHHIFSFAAA